jgi:hypothetical protein
MKNQAPVMGGMGGEAPKGGKGGGSPTPLCEGFCQKAPAYTPSAKDPMRSAARTILPRRRAAGDTVGRRGPIKTLVACCIDMFTNHLQSKQMRFANLFLFAQKSASTSNVCALPLPCSNEPITPLFWYSPTRRSKKLVLPCRLINSIHSNGLLEL